MIKLPSATGGIVTNWSIRRGQSGGSQINVFDCTQQRRFPRYRTRSDFVIFATWHNAECVPRIFSAPVLFSGTKFSWYRYRYFFQGHFFPVPVLFPGPNFPVTDTSFGEQIFLVPVLFAGPICSSTGTFFRDQFFSVLIPVPPKKWKIPGNSVLD